MPEGTEPLGTGGAPTPSPTPGSGAGGVEPVASGETVPKERFDGLMSASQRREAELKAEIERLKAAAPAPAPAAPAAPVQPTVTPDVIALIEEAKGESKTVYRALKQTAVASLLEKYPFASADAVRGTSPEDWEASIKADHERIKAAIDKETAKVREETEARVREEVGAPLGVGAGGTRQPRVLATAEEYDKELEAAKERRDSQEVARLLMLGRPEQ